ncbi:MAG: two-component sensor histidine kinase, partial [Conexibacter sp.]|nr:two-component sensor histidine kinase [Conexibacter sp.]
MTNGPNPHLTRLSAWSAQRRWALDAVVVAVIVALGSLRGPDDHEGLTAWLFTVALALPLLWRRHRPVAVFAVITAVAVVQWALDIRAFGDSALLVALYTVAATQPLRTTLLAAAVLEVGIVMASLRWAPHGHPLDVIVALSGLATAAGVLGVNVRHRQALLDSLRERAARLEAERDQQGRLSAAGERARIAREMHDIVAHNLSVMIALADGATYAMRDDPDRAEVATRNASRTGREALTEMRRLLGVLREDEPAGQRAPQPGIDQLDVLVEQVRAAGVPTTITLAGAAPEHVSGGLQLAAFRIVQEALTNALKHAGPGVEAAVDLRWTGPRLRLEIVNTGQPATARGAEGGGLRGMRERA